VVVDCAALPATLAEDALFGHVRGAFTGASEDRAGPFERAHGGTIFLDEIGDLLPELQMKLLRALQSRAVLRLGSTREVAVDVRVIAATHVDLARARERGAFREDLFYRLSVFELEVPALRDRGSADVRVLITTIIQRLAARRGIAVPAIDAAAMDLLLDHSWPGNVRELENTLERMLVAASGAGMLSRRHLPDGFAARRGRRVLTTAPPDRERIREVLERSGFRPGLAAADLGLSRHQLYRLAKRHGIALRGCDS
jgi:transcriptional regulator with GAF, ATPase, and Fis domain